MIKFILSLSVTLLLSSISLAGTPTHWNNDALGFTLIETTQSVLVDVCNKDNVCMTFKPTNRLGKMTEYTEVSGKCKITTEVVEANHGNGSNDDFMLRLLYLVVKVKDGDEFCKMKTQYSGYRSLTGIYL